MRNGRLRPLELVGCVLAVLGTAFWLIYMRFEYRWRSAAPLDYVNVAENKGPPAGIAFFIQVSEGNFNMLTHLMDAIYHPGNLYILHFDARMSASAYYAALFASSSYLQYENVRAADQRDYISWGGVSILLNLLVGVASALEWPAFWTHLIFIAPSNYPLLSPADMRHILAEYPNQSFTAFYPYETLQPSSKAGILKHSVEYQIDPAIFRDTTTTLWDHERLQIPWEPLSTDGMGKGELWQILSKVDCEYLASSPLARKSLVQVLNTPAAEEIFFSNVMMTMERERLRDSGNSQAVQPTLNDHLHHIVWWHPEIEQTQPFQHPFVMNSAELFLPGIEGSGALFCRKFDTSEGSLDIIQKINSRLIGNETFVESARQRIRNARPLVTSHSSV